VFDPVERIVGAFGRQLDSRAAPPATYKKRPEEVGERIVKEAFFALSLGRGFWSPVNKTAWEFSGSFDASGTGEDTCLDDSGGVRDGGTAHPGLCRAALSLELCNGRGLFVFVRGPSELEA
jgi:hypothetical protein